jgi:hypothetical protein
MKLESGTFIKETWQAARNYLVVAAAAEAEGNIIRVAHLPESDCSDLSRGIKVLAADISIELLLYAALIANVPQRQEDLYTTYQQKLSQALAKKMPIVDASNTPQA